MFLLLLGFLLVPGLSAAQSEVAEEVNPEAVAALLANGALFVDVRETNEVAVLAYDLPGVVYVPLSELPDRLAELPRNQPIVLACRTGKRSLKAATLLTENSFTQLFNLTGGIIAWEASSLPVSTPERVIDIATPKKACCSAKGTGEAAATACCSKKTDAAATEKASCGEKGKAKGKSCCSGGGR